ncbi:hypothetical protein Y032_0254g289 [Ancylostoma ceylanicum]|uniref:Uncharacterized protein n=1 Tax=Ancylostoma ceylanicum TaxID=53326 RepID=A0A016SBD6_9BILA|nr:hypothetical protein Y032_0254g289 [Ancylostoma ceylanicum]
MAGRTHTPQRNTHLRLRHMEKTPSFLAFLASFTPAYGSTVPKTPKFGKISDARISTGPEVNMMNDLAPELRRKKRAAWRAYKSIEDVVKKTNPAPSTPRFSLL